MKKIFLLILVICLYQYIIAQDKGFSIGLGGSFDKRLNEYYDNPWVGFDHEFSDISEFSFGTQISYHFSDRIGLRSGISYSRKGYKLIYAWITPDGNNGVGDPLIPLESEFRLKYLDVPVSLFYKIVNANHYTFSASIGMMNSINIGESEISEMGDGTSKETAYNVFNTNSYLAGARIGLINNIDISENVFISIEPYFMYNFFTLNDTDIEKSDFAFGGYLSVNYRLNKK